VIKVNMIYFIMEFSVKSIIHYEIVFNKLIKNKKLICS